MVWRALVILLALVSAGCGSSDVGATAPPTASALVAVAADLTAQFAYDASAPIDLVERSSAPDGALTVRDIDYASPKGGRARAYLITPQTAAPVPAMVFVAGSNEPRDNIRAEALSVARRGVVALVLEQSQIAAARSRIWTFTAQDRVEAIQTVVDVRRAIDLLVARADVDRTRIGHYGFSYGAWLGAIAGAVDTRVSLLVLRSGGPQILTELARASGRTLTPEYSTLMATVDQMRYAPSIAGSVLVQNGARDTTFTAEQMRAWQERIGGAKTVKTYDAGHSLSTTANADAVAWIAERWRLP
ncbi:MAG: dienelactone hydrolase family protein [Chloroflexota bacterium]